MSLHTDEETQATSLSVDSAEIPEEDVPALTILAHPDARRVGDRLVLAPLAVGQAVLLARLSPIFTAPRRGNSGPLGDRSISRRAIRFLPGEEPGELTVDLAGSRTAVAVDGERVVGSRVFTASEVARGIALVVGRRVTLLLHLLPLRPNVDEPGYGLVGESVGIVQVRQEIRRLAHLDLPILLRGETGTGKELVARALHESSPRHHRPFVAVNMATITPSLAASELFGATRGAYTGAAREKVGFFQHADGGTLFLDEIGETPIEVQPMLLRALEAQEILPVGAVEPQRLDVRVIAATDAQLHDAIAEGRFRAPLLHRLAGYSIRLPSLAERRDDLGRLLHFFLDAEINKIDDTRFEGHVEAPWPPAEIVARLARHDWPGNVRELHNVARWLLITGRDFSHRELGLRLEAVLEASRDRDGDTAQRASSTTRPPRSSLPPRRRRLRQPEDFTDEELRIALKDHRWELSATATALGMSRAGLYRWIDEHPMMRKAADLSRDELEAALERFGDQLEAAADEFQVSLRGLKRRLTAVGIRRS